MKKRVIKNLSVLLCAAMLAGSLGYGTIAAEPESDVVSAEQAEVKSETVGMKTTSMGDEIVGAVDGISDEPKGDEKDDLETDNSSAQEGDESEEPEESLKLLGGGSSCNFRMG